MFTAVPHTAIPYADPWMQSFEDRLTQLCTRDRHIAYFYERPDTSTFRYRVFNMVEALNSAPDLITSASWFTRDDLQHVAKFIDRADALVICRTRYDDRINNMVCRARARGIRVFFDTDDLVFDPAYVHVLLDTLDQPREGDVVWDHWFGWIGRIGATMRLCDAAILTNDFLAERVRACAPGMSTHVIPNFLNRIQQFESERIWQQKLMSRFERDAKIHIGYFSGTPTHALDFEIAVSALARLLDDDPRIVIRMVGFMEPKDRLLPYRDRIEIHPLQDFVNLQRLIGQVELNIAPLQNNAFTNCKSELKYFEAAMVGTVTVASPTYTFRGSIRDGENGFLARDHEWEQKIRAAMDTLVRTDDYRKIAECAFHECHERYRWDRFGPEIEAAIFGTSAQETASGPAIIERGLPSPDRPLTSHRR